jgi:hypothetical protein
VLGLIGGSGGPEAELINWISLAVSVALMAIVEQVVSMRASRDSKRSV